MKISNQIKIEHLFQRAGFGATPAQVQEFGDKLPAKAVKYLLKDSAKNEPLIVIEEQNATVVKRKALKDTLLMGGTLSAEMIRERLKENRDKITDLNFLWVNKMASGGGMLREKMALFWHGHFACRSRQPLFDQQLINVIRQNALGKFSDLLLAVSKSPAMLQFLNNQQNKKGSPNENFAREVMELFTLGRGNYTENDIKEAARAFTGWSFNSRGEFDFRDRQHDSAEKTFQGKTGNFKGEDIIKIILQNPQTATFITTKIYHYFVNENPDNQVIEQLSKRFRSSDYDLADLMENIFTSNWFYRTENIGTRIKSPVELLVGMQRNFGITFQQKQAVLFIQKSLGQILFYPPNVAGWAGGKSWIDSSTLMTRMKLPEVIFKNAEVTFKPKDDGDVNTEYLSKRVNRIQAKIDWHGFENTFSSSNQQDLVSKIESYLLSRPLSESQKKVIQNKTEGKSGAELVQMIAQNIASLPEYQLG
ncbi:MAG: DUF1800 domain-containing protein [Arcicella sp.]|nr:DUF1800 domain-containing protein [Arcicella sp.]